MDDGVSIAATLYVPDGAAPAGGWPAVVFLHGLAGNRQQMNALVEGYGFADGTTPSSPSTRAATAQSGGLVGIDGPREVADIRAIRDWLAARPDVSDTKIGAWGISYGGGGDLQLARRRRSLGGRRHGRDLDRPLLGAHAAGAREVRRRRRASSSSIPAERRDPSLDAVQAAAFAGNAAAVKPWAAARSSISKLGSVTTPVFMAQGRRDFAFGIDQGTRAFKRLKGPKALYVGLHGHAPSTFPAADTGYLMTKAARVVRLLPARRRAATAAQVVRLRRVRRSSPGRSVAPRDARRRCRRRSSRSRASRRSRGAGRPRARRPRCARRSRSTARRRCRRRSRRAAAGRGSSPCSRRARRPGKEIVVSAGGVPTKPGAQKVTIQLIEPGDVRPEGVAAHAHARVVVDRAVGREPPLPRSARWRRPHAHASAPRSSSCRACARRSRSDRARRGRRARRAGARRDGRRRARRGSRRHVHDRPPRRNRPAHRRGRGVRIASARAPRRTSTTSTRRAA